MILNKSRSSAGKRGGNWKDKSSPQAAERTLAHLDVGHSVQCAAREEPKRGDKEAAQAPLKILQDDDRRELILRDNGADFGLGLGLQVSSLSTDALLTSRPFSLLQTFRAPLLPSTL